MLTEKTDEQLMVAYANQDINAFKMLYERHKTVLYRFLLRRVSDQSVAEEIFQDIWAKIIKAKDRYSSTASFRTYLFKIARNCLIDHYRKENIRQVEVKTEMTGSEQANCQDVSETIENQQRYTSIIDAIKQLPPEQRDVFLLKQEADLSISEIAMVVQVKEEAAKSRYRYAVARLKELLGHEDVK